MTKPLTEQELAKLFHTELPPAEMPGDLAARLEARVLADVALIYHTPIAENATAQPAQQQVADTSTRVRGNWLARLGNWPGYLGRTGSLTLAGSALVILLALTTMLPRIFSPAATGLVTGSQGVGVEEVVLPAALPAVALGQLSAPQGDVQIQRGASGLVEMLPPQGQVMLAAGDIVQTNSGRADISFFAGQSAELLPDTRVRVLELQADGDATHVVLFQESGLSSHTVSGLANSGDRYELRTAVARMIASEAGFTVDLRTDGAAIVHAANGLVTVETAQDRADVMADQTLQARADGTLVLNPLTLQAETDITADSDAGAVAQQPTAEAVSVLPAMDDAASTESVRPEANTTLLPTPTRIGAPAAASDVTSPGNDSSLNRPAPTPGSAADPVVALLPTRTPPSDTTAISTPATATPVDSTTATLTPSGTPTRQATLTAPPTPGSPAAASATPRGGLMPQATSTPVSSGGAPILLPTPDTPVESNQPPTAIEDTATTSANQPVEIPVLSNDYDADQDTLVVIGLSQPANGSASNNGNGVITYMPAPDFSGSDRFTYRISDGQAARNGTIYVTVAPVNQPPVIGDLSDRVLREDSVLNVPLNIDDPDHALTALSLRATSSNPELFGSSGLQISGTGASRSLALTPRADRFGEAMITVTIDDGEDQTTATFNVVVQAVNDAPTLGVIDPLQMSEGGTASVSFSVTDAESDPSELSVIASGDDDDLLPTSALQISGNEAARTLTIVPAPGRSGVAGITLIVSDGNASTSQTFIVRVAAVDDSPTIAPIADQTIAEDGSAALDVRLDDGDTSIDSLLLEATAEDPTLLAADGLQISGDGNERTLTITPAANRFGTTSITLRVSDGASSAETVFLLTVTPVNDPPALTQLSDQRVDEGQTLEVPIVLTDPDRTLNSLTVTAQSDNSALVGDDEFDISGSGGNRVLRLTPKAGQSGAARITVTVSDGQSQATAAFALTVTPVNDPPTLSAPDQVTIDEDRSGNVTITVNDPESASHELQVSAVGSDSRLLPDGSLQVLDGGESRVLQIKPAADQSGTAEIVVTVSDGALESQRTIRVSVNEVNDAPTITAIDDQTLSEGTSREIVVTVADLDHGFGDVNVWAESTNPALLNADGLILNGDGGERTLRVAPNPGQNGRASVTLFVSDGQAQAETRFDVTVEPVNDPPEVQDDVISAANEPVVLRVLENDRDDERASLRIERVSAPSHGTVEIDGDVLRYIPTPDFRGTDQFSYTVSDGEFSASGQVTVTIE